jgi:hypothetical protein
VIAATGLVRTQVIAAEQTPLIFDDEGLPIRAAPICNSRRGAHVAWQGIGFADGDFGKDQRGDRRRIIGRGRADHHRQRL